MKQFSSWIQAAFTFRVQSGTMNSTSFSRRRALRLIGTGIMVGVPFAALVGTAYADRGPLAAAAPTHPPAPTAPPAATPPPAAAPRVTPPAAAPAPPTVPARFATVADTPLFADAGG